MAGPAGGDRLLIALVDGALAEASCRSGAHLVCRPGCTWCCFGPFPITALDAWRLRRGLEALEIRDPERAGRIRDRARRAADEMASDFPGDAQTGLLNGDEEAEERFCIRY